MVNNRLYRDKERAMLGGVCAGLANRFNLDPTLVRIGVIAIAVITAALPVALVYVALWIIMPAAAEGSTKRPSRGELTEEFKTAGSRVTEAGRIVGRAARQAADELSSLQNRPVAPPPV
ncbi:MAG: PspC domain-containing protein, partial [Dehalococcoidia bacterium]